MEIMYGISHATKITQGSMSLWSPYNRLKEDDSNSTVWTEWTTASIEWDFFF